MKKNFIKIVCLTFLVLITFPVVGQNKVSKWDIRLGAGYSILGTGDYHTFNYATELNYKLGQYFTASVSLDLGRSITGISGTASFAQGNLNLFLSPFKNSKKNDFRIGTGLTFYDVSDTYGDRSYYENGMWVREYLLDHRNSFGYNIIIEDSYMLTERLLVGVKFFTQPYFNGDLNSGILLKLGYKLNKPKTGKKIASSEND